MAEKRDYYEILGVSRDAGLSEIKGAYRKLVQKYHPDKNKETDAAEKFKEIREAYEILSNEGKRRAYDQFGHAGVRGGIGDFSGYGDFGGQGFGGQGFTDQGFGGQGFSNFSDLSGFFGGNLGNIFENVFGTTAWGENARQRRYGPRKGNDIAVQIRVELEEAAFGVEKEIKYRRDVSCESCSGSGSKTKKKKVCPACGGKGRVRTSNQTIFGVISMTSVCPDCEGEGEVPQEICSECTGRAVVKKTESVKIKIPKGAYDGMNLMFKEKGDAGKNGGGYGDLFVGIEVKDHKLFSRERDNILIQYRIPLTMAVLGGEVIVPTLHGEEKMKIPGGTQFGDVITLKGKGVPKRNGVGVGDQLVKVVFDVPKRLGPRQKKLWQELEKGKL